MGKQPTHYFAFNLQIKNGFTIPHFGYAKICHSVVNLLDSAYEPPDASDVGVGAPQFGQRQDIYDRFTIDFGPRPIVKVATHVLATK